MVTLASRVDWFGLDKGDVEFEYQKEERDLSTFSDAVQHKYVEEDYPSKPKTRAEAERLLEDGKIEKLAWNGLGIGVSDIQVQRGKIKALVQPVRYGFRNVYEELASSRLALPKDNPRILGGAIVGILYDTLRNPYFALQIKGKALGEGALHTYVAGGFKPSDLENKDPFVSTILREAHGEVGLVSGDVAKRTIFAFGGVDEANGHYSIFCVPRLFGGKKASIDKALERFHESYKDIDPEKREVKGLVLAAANNEGIESLLNREAQVYFTPETAITGEAEAAPFELRPWLQAFAEYINFRSGALETILEA